VWLQHGEEVNLETPCLLLRPLVTADMDWLADLYADPAVNGFQWDRASTVKQARRVAIIYLDLHQCRFGHWRFTTRTPALSTAGLN